MIGSLLLAGLPEEYKRMIMGLECSGSLITGDSIKTRLLQDANVDSSGKTSNSETALHAKSQIGNIRGKYRGPRCFSCNESVHISKGCPKSKSQDESKCSKLSKNSKQSNAFLPVFSIRQVNRENWYINPVAVAHVTMNDHEMTEKLKPSEEEILVANNDRISVSSIGDVYLQIIAENQTTDTV